MEKGELLTLSPYDNFVYALKAEVSKRQYPRKLERFLWFIGLERTIQEKCSKLFEVINCDVNVFEKSPGEMKSRGVLIIEQTSAPSK